MMIREATVDDAPGIAVVGVLTWQSTYRGLVPDAYLDALEVSANTERWARALSNTTRQSEFLIAEAIDSEGKPQIIGYVIFGPAIEPDPVYSGEIYALYVLHDQQRRGIGRALVNAAAARLIKRGLGGLLIWVLTHNHIGRGFYEALGGKVVRSKPIEIGGALLEETAYGWADIRMLLLEDQR